MINTKGKIIRLIVILIAIFIVVELYIDFALIGLRFAESTPLIRSGTVPIDEVLDSDAEFIEAGVNSLKELDWWSNNANLIGLFKQFDCSNIHEFYAQYSLEFQKTQRISLLSENVYYATVEFNSGVYEIKYTLEDYGSDRIRSYQKLIASDVLIDSSESMRRAEQNGGKNLREQIDNNCLIYLSLIGENDWHVDYLDKDSSQRLLCFNIDPKTGVVTKIMERSFKPCQL